MDQLLRNIWKRKTHIYGHLHLQIFLAQICQSINGLPEPLYIFFFERQPGCQLMSSEFCKQRPASAHLSKHIVGFNGPSRSLHSFFRFRQHKYRTVIFFLQPSGNNSGNTLMAFRQIYNKHLILFQ